MRPSWRQNAGRGKYPTFPADSCRPGQFDMAREPRTQGTRRQNRLPSFISSGNGDPLEPQAVALANKLRSLGVDMDNLFFPATLEPALPHEYQFNLDAPQGREALDRMLVFLERVLSANRLKHTQSEISYTTNQQLAIE